MATLAFVAAYDRVQRALLRKAVRVLGKLIRIVGLAAEVYRVSDDHFKGLARDAISTLSG
ncbi:MAG: hypothetical protein N3G20_01645 [Verrucomicrobiae bacterium]|nr:hypothetical protein [Verrucomicrobiae bacterium]